METAALFAGLWGLKVAIGWPLGSLCASRNITMHILLRIDSPLPTPGNPTPQAPAAPTHPVAVQPLPTSRLHHPCFQHRRQSDVCKD